MNNRKARAVRHCLPLPLLLAICLSGGPAASAFYRQSPTDSTEPESLAAVAGLSVTGRLTGGQARTYRVALQPGHYLRVAVKQEEIDLSLVLYGPDRKKLAEADGAPGVRGTESASLIADTPGDYLVEVRSIDKGARPGGYELRVEESGARTAEGDNRVAAERAFAEGRRLRSQNSPESWRKAIEQFQSALRIWQAIGDKGEQGNTLHYIGRTCRYLGDLKNTLENYERALSVRRELKDRYAEAHTLNEMGLAHNELGDPQKALEYYDQALQIRREVNDRRGQAITLNNMGLSNMYLSNQQKAIAYFGEALSVWEQDGDRSMEANTLNNIGGAHYKRGEMQRALESFSRALLIRQELGNQRGQAQTLNNISLIYQDLGELQRALEHYHKALSIWHTVGDFPSEANTLDNIGTVYSLLGDLQTALDFHNQALPIREQVNDFRGQGNTLTHLGYVYATLEGPAKAIEYYERALKFRRQVNDRWGEGYTLIKMGEAYTRLGEPQKALDLYNRALELLKAAEDRQEQANALNKIAEARNSMGDPDKALDHYRQALAIWQSIGDRWGQATTLYGIARLERDRGNFAESLKNNQAAIEIVESLRGKVASQQLRISYLASVRDYYDLGIDTLMKLHEADASAGHEAHAFEVAERARARSLLEMLGGESHLDIRRKVDGALLERERSLRREIDSKEQARIQLLNGKHTAQQADAYEKELSSLIDRYQALLTEIKAKNPEYAALTQPQPLTLKEIQRQVLDTDTVLLEYSLGDRRSYLWAVTQDSIKSFELPRRAELEAQAKRVYDLLVARQPVDGETPRQYQARVTRADADYWPQATRLSQMLLGPAASALGRKRLLVVPEGSLQYVPFSALPAPSDETAGAGDEKQRPGGTHAPSFTPRPLVVDHEVVSLPSASVLAVLRRETTGRKPAPKAVAVIADPVFSKDDFRIKSSKNNLAAQPAKPSSGGDLSRALRDVGVTGDGLSMPRLPSTRREAQAIRAVASAQGSFEALDFQANRATASSAELGQYRIVHFATHGLLNDKHPELSGIVLSLVNDRGEPLNGFLRLHEIYNLNLPAELVVLSACSTALGKEVRGEGLVGLTRGFMYAGAERVMASLWNVNDLATANLMKLFYKAVMVEGLRPAAALRAAQVEMLKHAAWRAPYYWAAFILQGEWK